MKVRIKIPVYALRLSGETKQYYHYGDGSLIRAFSRRELEVVQESLSSLGPLQDGGVIEQIDTLEVAGEIDDGEVLRLLSAARGGH